MFNWLFYVTPYSRHSHTYTDSMYKLISILCVVIFIVSHRILQSNCCVFILFKWNNGFLRHVSPEGIEEFFNHSNTCCFNGNWALHFLQNSINVSHQRSALDRALKFQETRSFFIYPLHSNCK